MPIYCHYCNVKVVRSSYVLNEIITCYNCRNRVRLLRYNSEPIDWQEDPPEELDNNIKKTNWLKARQEIINLTKEAILEEQPKKSLNIRVVWG